MSKKKEETDWFTTMAIDQNGDVHHDLGPHPRKELLERLEATKAEKMYVKKKDGTSVHIGYVIKGMWLTLYEVRAWEKPA